MNGIPAPYPNGTRLVVGNTEIVVTDHAPNADDWRYTGHPVSLGGSEIHFSHHEAKPVPPRGVAPEPPEAEEPLSPLLELITAARLAVNYGPHHLDNLRGALLRFDEQTA